MAISAKNSRAESSERLEARHRPSLRYTDRVALALYVGRQLSDAHACELSLSISLKQTSISAICANPRKRCHGFCDADGMPSLHDTHTFTCQRPLGALLSLTVHGQPCPSIPCRKLSPGTFSPW